MGKGAVRSIRTISLETRRDEPKEDDEPLAVDQRDEPGLVMVLSIYFEIETEFEFKVFTVFEIFNEQYIACLYRSYILWKFNYEKFN